MDATRHNADSAVAAATAAAASTVVTGAVAAASAGPATSARCPFAAHAAPVAAAAPAETGATGAYACVGAGASAALRPDTPLALPWHKRVVVQRSVGANGAALLHFFHGDKEIEFEEPELFGFAETLAVTPRFLAGDAVAWGTGLDWPRVQPLLEELLAAGILRPADTVAPRAPLADGARVSPLPPAPATRARTWDECAAITTELAGRALESGYLELVVPVFRVAHMALDADGRQVGEANVFPPALRLDAPTRWRTCIYPGTRHQSERPMNVTALKAMRTHWPAMMALLLRVRAAYLERFPAAREGWTVGHLERLATCVLGLPSVLLLRAPGRVANGALHPALSSLFRVTDGLRMVMHQMLFVPLAEPTLAPDTPLSAADILAYAERNYSFHSEHGVCAGPHGMIAGFLAVLVDGRLPVAGDAAHPGEPAAAAAGDVAGDDAAAASGPAGALAPELEQALAALPQAIDYALLGLQAYAVSFSLWPAMARAYESLTRITSAWAADGGTAGVATFAARMAGHLQRVRASGFLAHEGWRVDRERVYGDMFERCAEGLGRPASAPLERLLAPGYAPVGAATALRDALRARFAPASPVAAGRLAEVQACLLDFLCRTQAILRAGTRVQRDINQLLGRAQPAQPLAALDLDIHNRLQDGRGRPRPAYLVSEIAALLDLDIRLDACVLEITPTRHPASAAAPHPSHGIAPSDTAAIPAAVH